MANSYYKTFQYITFIQLTTVKNKVCIRSIVATGNSEIPYTWNMASHIWQFTLKMQLTRFLVGGFEHCVERNPCLQPKWCTFNLAIFT